MIQIIDGKRYDTDKSSLVFSWSNGHYISDFRHREKNLYRTKSERWFFHHIGGPMSDMAVACNDGLSGSSHIEPIGDADAFGFLQSRSDVADARTAIEKYFADQVEDA